MTFQDCCKSRFKLCILLRPTRCYSLDIMVHQLSVQVEELFKQENWMSEPNGEHGFTTALVIMFIILLGLYVIQLHNHLNS